MSFYLYELVFNGSSLCPDFFPFKNSLTCKANGFGKLNPPEKSRINTQVRSKPKGKCEYQILWPFEVKKHQAVSCFQKDFPMILGYFGMGKISGPRTSLSTDPPVFLRITTAEDHRLSPKQAVRGQWVFWFGEWRD